MPKIELTSKARSDLDGIFDYYLPVIGSKAADQAIAHILERLTTLENFPHLGNASAIADCREPIFRQYPYRAIYSLVAGTLVVYRIIHQNADRH